MAMQPDELKSLRKAMKHTQGEMASWLGLSQGFIGEMERGEKSIDDRTERLVRALYAPLRPIILVGGSHDGDRAFLADGLVRTALTPKRWIAPFVLPERPAPETPREYYAFAARDSEYGVDIFAAEEGEWSADQALVAAREHIAASGGAA